MLKPINKKIILEIIENEEKTKSGIILSNNSNTNNQIGKIIAISKEIENEYKEIEINKKIIFDKYSKTEINYNEKEYVIIDIKDVLAIIE